MVNIYSALPKIIKTGFSAINLIYFFTAGPDEVTKQSYHSECVLNCCCCGVLLGYCGNLYSSIMKPWTIMFLN
jgi:hypothetical protein